MLLRDAINYFRTKKLEKLAMCLKVFKIRIVLNLKLAIINLLVHKLSIVPFLYFSKLSARYLISFGIHVVQTKISGKLESDKCHMLLN